MTDATPVERNFFCSSPFCGTKFPNFAFRGFRPEIFTVPVSGEHIYSEPDYESTTLTPGRGPGQERGNVAAMDFFSKCCAPASNGTIATKLDPVSDRGEDGPEWESRASRAAASAAAQALQTAAARSPSPGLTHGHAVCGCVLCSPRISRRPRTLCQLVPADLCRRQPVSQPTKQWPPAERRNVNRTLRGAGALRSPRALCGRCCAVPGALTRRETCSMLAARDGAIYGGCVAMAPCYVGQVGIMFETELDKEHGCCRVEGIAQYSGDILEGASIRSACTAGVAM